VDGRARGVKFSPDGRTLAIAIEERSRHRLTLLDVATGQRRNTENINRGEAYASNRMSFSPDGAILAYKGNL